MEKLEKKQVQIKPLDIPKLPSAAAKREEIEDVMDKNAAKTMSKRQLKIYKALKDQRRRSAEEERSERDRGVDTDHEKKDAVAEGKWVQVPKPGTVLTVVMIAVAALYLYKTVKDGGVVVNEQTGAKRSVFRWADIALGTFAALYILRSVRTFF